MSRSLAIAAGAGFSFGGYIIGQAVRFMFSLAVARLLGADALGTYALAMAVIQIAEVAALAGLDSALLRFSGMHRNDPVRRRRLIGFVLKTGFFLSLAVMLLLELLAGSLAGMLNGGRMLQLAIACYAAAVPFNAATMLYGHAMQAAGRIEPKIIATQVLSPLLLLSFTLLLNASSGREAALLFPFALSAASAFFWIRPRLSDLTGMEPGDWRRAPFERSVLSYAMPFLLVSLLSMTAHWLDIVMLGMLTDPGTVGLYHPAARTAGLIRAVLPAFAGMAAPMFAELHAAGSTGELERMYQLVTRWMVTVVVPPVLLFLLFPAPVLSVFGAHFTKAAPVLGLLTAGAFLQALFGISATLLAMAGHSRLSLLNALSALTLQVALNLLLIPRMGIEGAASAGLIVFGVLALARLVEVRLLLGLHPFSRPLLKPFVAGSAAGMLLIISRGWLLTLPFPALLAVAAGAAVAVYMGVLLILGLEEEDREIILRAGFLIGRGR
ncbi:oligosaccharide flippase family protein [Pelodictyon luteolum]|uniref:Polysaccharide efflux transporter, putative n=1 Tax=Chlorobium luteolum (strain DSM 273 / BCRC 81028 / 2530) TaxID=319225 RepID=Q3B6G9_CHLL3|nr:oligosaccharide flippase family protein [Pelodictyon luteolum]ABB23062.1 polysaccharide efflux transporter, putative [Pelodictyon luteolum DSM 273]